MTLREFIEHRKVTTSMISFPLWLAGFSLLAYGGKHSAWSPANYIGVCVLLASGIFYLTCIGIIRCPRCKGFIGLTTVSPFQNSPPQPESCVHCGLSFREPMSKFAGW
jgi:hypothetical protein